MNKLRTFVGTSAAEDGSLIEVVAADFEVRPVASDLDASIRLATGLAPEYLAACQRARREGVQLRYARNQARPQLDLRVSYGFNGLARSPSDSWDDAFEAGNTSWSAGMEFRVPLAGGKKSRGELRAPALASTSRSSWVSRSPTPAAPRDPVAERVASTPIRFAVSAVVTSVIDPARAVRLRLPRVSNRASAMPSLASRVTVPVPARAWAASDMMIEPAVAVTSIAPTVALTSRACE